ncbi:protein phosphatase 2C domain-containing protein [Nocardioides sp. SOB77]|uniref:Protein phosphatase 2C domain-containing protein n=1 Tax=Nocardioides oceani TaxID=3058369 RepID=A0ABT8FGR6_9ACTN|nr:protein phosphatase 2C domain-containing protein [Nocardioides oceani]MDN4173883.1 protein phosphatase 2C domain-containing protein [Nocardioides oceani]
MVRFSGAGVSDVGHVREHNEDSGFVASRVGLVADGVGGAAAGEIASATVAAAVVDAVLAHAGATLEQTLQAGADRARSGIRRAIQHDLTRLGMATTLTVLLCDGERVVLGHVGDSRAYRLRGGTLTQLSTDHTYVAHLVASGQLGADAVARHPWRNVVLRSVDGDPADQGVDLAPVDAAPGDRFLVCSDGLTDMVPDPEVARLLAEGSPGEAAAGLTEAALAAGGRDNITCVVLDLVDDAGVVRDEDGTRLGALADPVNVVDPGPVRIVRGPATAL